MVTSVFLTRPDKKIGRMIAKPTSVHFPNYTGYLLLLLSSAATAGLVTVLEIWRRNSSQCHRNVVFRITRVPEKRVEIFRICRLRVECRLPFSCSVNHEDELAVCLECSCDVRAGIWCESNTVVARWWPRDEQYLVGPCCVRRTISVVRVCDPLRGTRVRIDWYER